MLESKYERIWITFKKPADQKLLLELPTDQLVRKLLSEKRGHCDECRIYKALCGVRDLVCGAGNPIKAYWVFRSLELYVSNEDLAKAQERLSKSRAYNKLPTEIQQILWEIEAGNLDIYDFKAVVKEHEHILGIK
jgi:hypothetical protein